MARINIEEGWWTSPRRRKLVKLMGSEELADGIAVGFWRIAQEFWANGKQPIPLAQFELLEASSKLIEAGLAKIEADGVHAYGAAESFEWVYQKRVAASKGGKKSAETRRAKGDAQPRKPRSKPEAESKQTPSTPQVESKHFQPSSSSSYSSSLILPVSSKPGGAQVRPPDDDRNPVALWVKAYKEKYGVRYAFQKKDFGMLTEAGKTHGPDQLEVLFACYVAIDEKLYRDAKHPLSLFFRDLQKISVAAQTGVDPSQPEEPEWKRQVRAEEARRAVNGV